MKIYFHDNSDADQRLPHEGQPATVADLEALCVYATNIQDQAEVDRIAEERGYRNRDEVPKLVSHKTGPAWLGFERSVLIIDLCVS